MEFCGASRWRCGECCAATRSAAEASIRCRDTYPAARDLPPLASAQMTPAIYHKIVAIGASSASGAARSSDRQELSLAEIRNPNQPGGGGQDSRTLLIFSIVFVLIFLGLQYFGPKKKTQPATPAQVASTSAPTAPVSASACSGPSCRRPPVHAPGRHGQGRGRGAAPKRPRWWRTSCTGLPFPIAAARPPPGF